MSKIRPVFSSVVALSTLVDMETGEDRVAKGGSKGKGKDNAKQQQKSKKQQQQTQGRKKIDGEEEEDSDDIEDEKEDDEEYMEHDSGRKKFLQVRGTGRTCIRGSWGIVFTDALSHRRGMCAGVCVSERVKG